MLFLIEKTGDMSDMSICDSLKKINLNSKALIFATFKISNIYIYMYMQYVHVLHMYI